VTRDRDRRSAASVRARLLHRAKRDGDEFQRVLVNYANERLLYRLSRSQHRDAFVLKGASLFALWQTDLPRPTKDIDLLGTGLPSPARLRQLFVDIVSVDVEPDGLTFDPSGVRAQPIREDAVYDGVRVTFVAKLGTAMISMQVDVGFGDAVEPMPEVLSYPTLLDMPAPSLRTYRREVVVAEKFHAMVILGLTNSRMKDYFDIAFLAQHFAFEAQMLSRALRATFSRRKTALPDELPIGLTDRFADDAQKRAQWSAFVRRVRGTKDASLTQAVSQVRAFVWPVASGTVPAPARWSGGPGSSPEWQLSGAPT
jgi:predicted nucleotidyltransferase component of viral defense system